MITANHIVHHSPREMTPGERRFKDAICELVWDKVHPTPTRINRALGHKYADNNLHGDQVRWLRAIVGRWRGNNRPVHGSYPLCEAACCVDDGYYPVVDRTFNEVRA